MSSIVFEGLGEEVSVMMSDVLFKDFTEEGSDNHTLSGASTRVLEAGQPGHAEVKDDTVTPTSDVARFKAIDLICCFLERSISGSIRLLYSPNTVGK